MNAVVIVILVVVVVVVVVREVGADVPDATRIICVMKGVLDARKPCLLRRTTRPPPSPEALAQRIQHINEQRC